MSTERLRTQIYSVGPHVENPKSVSERAELLNKRFLKVRRKERIISARFNTKNKIHWEQNWYLRNHN